MKRYLSLVLLLFFGWLAGYSQPSDLSLSSYDSTKPTISALRSITLTSGFHVPSGSNLRIFIQGNPNLATVPTATQNYIFTRTFRVPVKVGELSQVRSVEQESQTIQYFDGLGRAIQTVQVMASPSYKDIVEHIAYDGFGREAVKYLPYADQSSSNGSFKTTASVSQKAFYSSSSWDTHVAKTDQPFSVTVFENSPLNRVLEQGAPGAAWQPQSTGISGSGHTVKTDYGTNQANEVPLWRMKPGGRNASYREGTSLKYYQPGTLYKTVVKDENWVSGKKGTVEEFKDFEERVVLKRVWETDSKSLSTQYIYDDFGDLRYVLPPLYKDSTVVETASPGNFQELAYAYFYDGRRRLIEKKVPGKGWEYLVYNQNDQVVLTQDAVQRAKTVKEWNYNKYDAFGRITETGIYTSNLTRDALQNSVNAEASGSLWESRTSRNYTNASFPRNAKKAYLINYYDDYVFRPAAGYNPTLTTVDQATVKTLQTGSLVFDVNRTDSLLTVNYYDKRGRMVEAVSKNHLGGQDRISNEYNFSGGLIKSSHAHTGSPTGAVLKTNIRNIYDHAGRLKEVRHQIGTQDSVTLKSLAYNELGQLKQKKLHGSAGGKFISSVNYGYNERGWANKISSKDFSQKLLYNEPSTTATPQFNGNISQQQWGHGMATNSSFVYSYDGLNRLTSAVSDPTAAMTETLSYDDMGNILTMKRDNGAVINYSYNNGNKSNRLLSLSGGLTGNYTYDVNGNATKDRTGMTFSYNQLNLPSVVSGAGKSVIYNYTASGVKLRKTYTAGTVTEVRDYVGPIEYSKTGTAANTIERIATDEGYLLNAAGTYVYHYSLTDHLGNVRSVIKKGVNDTSTVVVQKQDYYAFGKTKSILSGGNNHYLYNGKEVQAELGDQLDYGARFYDPEIGRWNVVDLKAEKYESVSSYSYSYNNPIRFIDIKGKDPGDIVILFTGGIVFYPYQENTPSTQNLYNNLYNNRNGERIMLYPSIYYDSDKVMEHALKDIKENNKDDPKGRVVIYGYSYGGVIATHLAKKLQDEGINVNLLITIDAANGPVSSLVDREMPDNVLANLNFYQRNKDIIYSRGGKATGKNTFNINKTNDMYNGEKINHGNIDDATLGISQNAIKQLIQNTKEDTRTLTKEEIKSLFAR